MTKQSILIGAAALVALAAPASASQSPGEAQRVIHMAGYDLSSPAERKALVAEIRAAAREVCAPAREASGSRLSFLSCMDASSRAAMRKLELMES